jgi:hypothetical protein
MSQNKPDIFRDPIWTFIGVLVAIVAIAITLLVATGRLAFLAPGQIASTTEPSANSWNQHFSQATPNCNNPAGTNWETPLPGTALNCSNNGVIVQEAGSGYSGYYAEVDLDRINNTTYSQTNFRVQTQITFQNTSDTVTSAGLIIQTPQSQGAAGGYILEINALGKWALQQVVTGSQIPPVRSGKVTINTSDSVTITITVQQGTLNAWINNNQVISHYNEQISSNTSVQASGLIVEHPGGFPSPILFSNFKLDYQ